MIGNCALNDLIDLKDFDDINDFVERFQSYWKFIRCLLKLRNVTAVITVLLNVGILDHDAWESSVCRILF